MSLASNRVKSHTLVLATVMLSACSSLQQQAAPVIRHEQVPPASAPRQLSSTPEAGSAGGGDVEVMTPRSSGPIVSRSQPVAPVSVVPANAAHDDHGEQPTSYTVQQGDNLFRIALNNGFGYRELAEMNGIANPDDIKVGQVLILRPSGEVPTRTASAAAPAPRDSHAAAAGDGGTLKHYPKALKLPYSDTAVQQLAARSDGANGDIAPGTKTATAAASTKSAAATKPATPAKQADAKATPKEEKKEDKKEDKPAGDGEAVVGGWMWPTDGKPMGGFTDKTKGIEIPGKLGQAVVAASDGKVVYSGSGLRGYGQLVIIKHDKTFLSAYAHNSKLLVKEGQSVKKGQKIAEMGNTDADQVKLHFEIRRYGKPVDPAHYLAVR